MAGPCAGLRPFGAGCRVVKGCSSAGRGGCMTAAPQRKIQAAPAPEGLDPHTSVWVSASAGSGKTTLLVKRVLRLLLEGGGMSRRAVPRILCLTYTRAAAA